MSPPLVVAFALAGRADIDMSSEPLGTGLDGKNVFLRDVWPTTAEVEKALLASVDAATYRRLYADLAAANPLWKEIPAATGTVYAGTRYPPTSSSRLSSMASGSSRLPSPTFAAPALWRSSATRSRRTTSAPPERSRRARRRAPTSSRSASRPPTSTATGRGAATTAS
jgi:hypothetical protein